MNHREVGAVLKPGGTLSSLGVYADDLKIPLAAFHAGLGGNKIVTSLCPGGKERMRRLLNVIASGRIDLEPLVTHRFRLEQIEEAYELFANQRDGVPKVPITKVSRTQTWAGHYLVERVVNLVQVSTETGPDIPEGSTWYFSALDLGEGSGVFRPRSIWVPQGSKLFFQMLFRAQDQIQLLLDGHDALAVSVAQNDQFYGNQENRGFQHQIMREPLHEEGADKQDIR